MTCIAALVHEGQVWIGGDAAGTDSNFGQEIRDDKKVFRNGPYVLGFTSSFRMGQLLQYSFDPPVPDDTEDIMRFMVNEYIDALKECYSDKEYKWKKEGSTHIVGYKGHLFAVHDDLQVGIPSDGYYAVGSGATIASGSLHATVGQDPRTRIRTALKAAERMNAAVRGPFTILATKA